jgi:hypothetical protein
MPHPRSLLTPFLLTSLVAACGGDDPARGDARFRDLTADQREEAVSFAVTGGVLLSLEVFAADLAHAGDPSCPSRVVDGDVMTFTADGCTNAADGVRYDGTLVARNVPSFSGGPARPSQPMSIEADAWTSGGPVFHGGMEQSLASPSEGDDYSFSVDFHADLPDGVIEQRSDGSCVLGGGCTLDGWAALPTGSFGIEGDFDLGAPSGYLALRGDDELRLDLDLHADGCTPYTIDGERAGEICVEPEPEPEPLVEIIGAGAGCGFDGEIYTLDLEAWVVGDAASVEVRIVEEGADLEESHALDETDVDPETGAILWWRTLSGADSQFANCFDRPLTYVITATDSEGATACTTVGVNEDLCE